MHDTTPLQHCHARAKQSGNRQCRNAPMRGQQVCRMHGGKQPAALANAEDRMRALVHPAVTALANLIADNDLAAAKYVLDYAGFRSSDAQPDLATHTMHVTVAFDHANTHADTLENVTFSLPDAD